MTSFYLSIAPSFRKISLPESMEIPSATALPLSRCILILIISLSFSPPLLSSAYTTPTQYFISCGSGSSVTVNGRNFVGDGRPTSFSVSGGQSTDTKDSGTPLLYQTARIFRGNSWYELEISQNGTYVVRFHFYPSASWNNLLYGSDFNVSASGFSLLSNFSVGNSTDLPTVKEFLLTVSAGKFRIYFTPSRDSSPAFVNAIEAFLAPDNFIPVSAPRITPAGRNGDSGSLSSLIFRPVYRINVGGPLLSADNDTLWRNWVPDDDYIYFRDAAINSEPYSGRPKYQEGGATEYDAPDFVYRTAKELNTSPDGMSNFFNITWSFEVRKDLAYLVRAHFCDIVSQALSDGMFNFYIHTQFREPIQPGYKYPQLAAPFFNDYVVDSGPSDFINVSIGPSRDSNFTAFLNGLEIMEIMNDSYSGIKQGGLGKSSHKLIIIVIGLAAGGTAFLFILAGAFLFGMKCAEKKKRRNEVEQTEWPAVPSYGGDFYSLSSDRTAPIASPYPNLNLGLKVPFAEVLQATSNFNPKLLIGEGGFGKVYKGILPNGMIVAVKRSEPGHGQGLPEFQTEIIVLSRIRHLHLVSLIGYCDERSEMILIYEYMEKGTLKDHLYGSNGDFKPKLTWDRRLEICIGAAKGLHYLHTGSDGGIIHRDVKSTNILLDGNYVAKVADFGISRLGPLDQSETHVSTNVKGSFGYLDPEYFQCLKLTQKSDVYSFGVVLLEVLCARSALDTLRPREQMNLAEWGISHLKRGEISSILDPFLEGKVNPNSLRKFGEMVEKCLKEHGDERPGMIDVLWDLEYALQLQQTEMPREPHEDSTNDASWELPLPAIYRLPSRDITTDDSDAGWFEGSDPSGLSSTKATEVFSQLKIDGAGR